MNGVRARPAGPASSVGRALAGRSLVVLALFAALVLGGPWAGSLGPGGPFAAVSPVQAQESCPEPTASEAPNPEAPLLMPEDYRIALFDGVWNAVNDLYLDPDFNGVDWQAVSDEYATYFLQTDNAYEVYSLLEEMVGLLDDPYTLFLTPAFIEEEQTQGQPYGGIGALLDRSASADEVEGIRILYVFPGSPADEAGIRPRDRVIAVEGDPCVLISNIRGPIGTRVRLTVVSPGEEPRDLSIERRSVAPVILPDSRRIGPDADVGYLRLNTLAGEATIAGVTDALTGLLEDGELAGLILDLRATSEGAPAVALELLGQFVEGDVATLYSRAETAPLTVTEGDMAGQLADVPVVVLVDEVSEGPAEQVAAILQDQGRAVVVGQGTQGRTQGAQQIDFPDGSRLQLVAYGLELSDGHRLEDTGVVPDIEVDEDWLAYPESEDPFLRAALEVIESGGIEASPEPSSEPEPSPSPEPEASPGA